MTGTDPKRLRYFDDTETLYGTTRLVNYRHYDMGTMLMLDDLRHYLMRGMFLIRGGVEHGDGKETAVDAVCPSASPEHLLTGLMRLSAHWGYYQGGSFHVDRRPVDGFLSRRWIAFRLIHRDALIERGFQNILIPSSSTAWAYCAMDRKLSWQALNLLVQVNSGLIDL